MPVGERQTLRFGPFELDTQCEELRRDGVRLKLQGQPVQILEILLEKPGQLVTREELRSRLWSSDTFVDFDHSLNTAIKKLRQALGDEAGTPQYIETIPKHGYRFIGQFDRETPKQSSGSSIPVTDETASRVVGTLAGDKRSASRNSAALRLWPIVASFVVGAFGVGALLYWATKPAPVPHIVGSHALTHTRRPKGWETWARLDSVFFSEETSSGPIALRVPLEGGEAVQVPWLNGRLADISRDGAQFLFVTDEGVWTQSASGGGARLVIKDRVWPFWTADAHGIFLIRARSDATERFAELSRVNADGTGMQHLATLPGVVFFPQLSPDGSRIRFSDLRGYRLWDIGIDGRNAQLIMPGIKDSFVGAWSPDGKYHFFVRGDERRFNLWWRPETSHWWSRRPEAPQQLTYGPMWVAMPSISSDGKRLFALGMEVQGELAVYERKSRNFVPYLSGISAFFVDFSRDGQWITYSSYPEGCLWRSRIDGSDRRQLTSGGMTVFVPRWSPDGKWIAFSAKVNEGADRIYLVSADGGSPLLLLSGEDIANPSWSPDGNLIAYEMKLGGVQKIRILDLRSQLSIDVPGSKNLFSPRWSPDGKFLLALSAPWLNAKRMTLFNFATSSWEELASGDQRIGWPTWSTDSKHVFAINGTSLVRIAVADHRKELIGSYQGFRLAEYGTATGSFSWFGATPDGRPITTLDKGVQEIYEFDVEYK